ncbi:MAG: SxtJ family membrane protein [Kofleriaceae bacterium]|nr:SxtJ family membrane protein [Kofleriaceae bacterium]
MAMVEIEWHPSPQQLRRFGVALLCGFAALAVIAEVVLERHALAVVLAGIGGGTGLVGLTGTVVALPIYWVWMGIAYVMGNITSRVLVATLFFGLITPIGLAMRLFGRDKLQRTNPSSTWRDLPPVDDVRSYERQF